VKADNPKATKPSRKEYNPYGNSYKAKKMAYMEVR
jgi:hypothetical protein